MRSVLDRDPAHLRAGEVIATVPAGSRADAKCVVEAPAVAFKDWSQSPPAARQRVLIGPSTPCLATCQAETAQF